MKKSLLATTAIAALGAVAVASPASAKFEVGVSGYMEQWFGYVDSSDSTNRNSDMFDQFTDAEFNVDFKQTLDNGLTIGGQIQVEGQQPAGEIDEQFINIDGSFGRIQIGTDNGAPYLMHYGIASNGIGIDEGDVAHWIPGAQTDLRTTSTTTNIDNDANKISYFSPRVSGFQFGATYMPNSDDVNAVVPRQDVNGENDGSRDNTFGLAANYVGSFADLSVKASIGYMDAGADKNVAGQETALSSGVQLGFGGFTASFAYGEYNRDDGVASDVNVFGVGLGYKTGPVGVSIGYIRGEDSDSNEDQDNFELGASYAMGPGVTFKSSIYYVETTRNSADVANGVAVAAGLALNF
jgi:outer membrane protein OmpU